MAASNFSNCIKEYLGRQFNFPEEQVESMMPQFRRTLVSHMTNLEKIHRQESLGDLEKAAHTIKGAFLNLGLTDCAELAKQIEGGAANNDTTIDYTALIAHIGDIVNAIVKER
ncbi:MAG: Hpt domain-containing protein [Desulfopila sp.]|jgi:HPt (histidine-containing phosphotransfer) domain-containing protein|nr:Hpt domain-containing protein [Desulfopila sp.]